MCTHLYAFSFYSFSTIKKRYNTKYLYVLKFAELEEKEKKILIIRV